jgi:hypothetical protein
MPASLSASYIAMRSLDAISNEVSKLMTLVLSSISMPDAWNSMSLMLCGRSFGSWTT